MIASLECHLKEAGSSISIAKDREFVNSRKVLEGKARFLRERGHGRRPRASKALETLSIDDENGRRVRTGSNFEP